MGCLLVYPLYLIIYISKVALETDFFVSGGVYYKKKTILYLLF